MPGYYNQRFRPSQGLDNVYVHYWSNIHSAYGQELVWIIKVLTFYSIKQTEILTNSLTQTISSKMTSQNGEWELQITCTKSFQDFTDQMMDGLEH